MEQQNGETNVPKTLGNKANENQVEQRNKANENQIEQGNKGNGAKEQRKKAKEANENPVDNSKQKDREGPEQNSSKGSLEGSQVQKCSVSFEETQKNGSLEACRERSGSGGSSISSNGSSSKSSGSSNGSSKKVVVVRSAPITIGKVKVIKTPVGPFSGEIVVEALHLVFQIEKKRADSPRSPPVVPPIPEDEEEELLDFVCARWVASH